MSTLLWRAERLSAAGAKRHVREDTISGMLLGMDFDERRIRLTRPDRKSVSAYYDEESKRLLIEHRTLDDAERLCTQLNARLGLDRDAWWAIAARSMGSEGDGRRH